MLACLHVDIPIADGYVSASRSDLLVLAVVPRPGMLGHVSR